jgi:hypothetical protein
VGKPVEWSSDGNQLFFVLYLAALAKVKKHNSGWVSVSIVAL